MKFSRRFLSMVCAVCMLFTISAPAFASDSAVGGDTSTRKVIDDHYFYQNMAFSGDYFEFYTTADKPYFRVAIQNTTSKPMTLHVFSVEDGVESSYTSTTIQPGKWGTTNTKYEPSTDFHIRLSCTEGVTPTGVISVRISAQDFSRSLDLAS